MSGKTTPDMEQVSVVVTAEPREKQAINIQEATDLYGNAEIARSYGYVTRGLKARHVQFMGLGGSIGTALFLGIGRALAATGPLSMFLGFLFTGMAIWGMMQCLGEMTTWLPVSGALPVFASRYVDNALAFAVGWNGWYGYVIGVCIEIAAAAVIIGYWNDDLNVAIWISIVIVVLILLNILAVSIYGEAEFWFASLKLITIVGLLLLALIIDLGGAPSRDRIGFRYWKNPGSMNTFLVDGDTGRFLGVVFAMIMAAYTYAGVESVVVAAGEAENPRRNLPKAVRRVFWRLLFFYIFGSLAIGVLVPYNDPSLLIALATSAPGAASSPWVIAIKRAGIPVLPSIINAVILSSACSAGNAFLYNGSRYLMSLAQLGLAPRIFMRCSSRGIPLYSVGLTALFAPLTYLSCSTGPAKVFIWLANLGTLVALTSWMAICVTYLRFYAALKAQGVDRDQMVFKSPFQPYLAWSTLIFFSVLTFFNGFYSFMPWNVETFITTYIGLPIFLALFTFWKLFKKTKFVKPSEADLWTGKAAIDAEVWPDTVPRNLLEKVWEVESFQSGSDDTVEEAVWPLRAEEQHLSLSSGLELLELSLKSGGLTLRSYMVKVGDVQELRETSPYLIAKFYSKYHLFMIGPSFAPAFRQAVQQTYLSSPLLLEGIYMAMFTAIDWRGKPWDEAEHPDFAQGAVSLQQLRTTQIMGSTDAQAIVALGQTLAAFDLLTKCVNSSLILRYSLSSIQPWYQELSEHSSMELFTVASIFWDTSWSLLRREHPIIKFCPPCRPVVDRLAGLCTTLLPILYDLCIVSHKMKHKRYSQRQSGIAAIGRIRQRILTWTTDEPENLTEMFSKDEVLSMKTQALMYQSAGLLIAHRLVNQIGTQDDVALLHAENIVLEFLSYQELAGKDVQLQQVGFPILIAALELPDFPSEIWESIPLLTAAPTALAKLQASLDYVWKERRQGYSGYILDLVDQGPEFVVIP